MYFWGHPFLSSLPRLGGVCMCICVRQRERVCNSWSWRAHLFKHCRELARISPTIPSAWTGSRMHRQMLSSTKPRSPNAWGSQAASYGSHFLWWEIWCSNSLWSFVTNSKDRQKSLESWSLLFSCLKKITLHSCMEWGHSGTRCTWKVIGYVKT